MLTLNNNQLKTTKTKINSFDTLIYLDADIKENVKYIGVLELGNKTKKVIDFINVGNLFQARLVIALEDLPLLNTSSFLIITANEKLSQQSNLVKFEFDVDAIKQTIKISASNELLEFTVKLNQLEATLSSLVKGKVIKELNIQNKNYIKPGMIPVSIDEQGNCVMMYPFANNIREVNGQKAANGVVEIDATMIKYNLGKTIAQALNDQADALSKIADALKTLSEEQKAMRKRVDELDVKLSTHINDGII